MELELKPDFDESYARYEAFWNRDVLDRPPVCIKLPHPEGCGPGSSERSPTAEGPASDALEEHAMATLPPALDKSYPDHRSRWLDLPARMEREVWHLEHTDFLGDAMPVAFPNMGPEIFSTWCGAGYEFGETTTWSSPSVRDWPTDGPAARFDENHPLYLATVELTNLLIEAGKGRFIVGLTDFHPGGDHLAALRDPEQLAIDLSDQPDFVAPMLEQAKDDFFRAYETFYERIEAAGMPTTSWLELVHCGRYYIPSNDFSAMISPAMFEEFFLDEIAEECRYLDRSIYHLDGPDAIQFVPGAGNEELERWIPLHQKIQNAGKAQQIIGVSTDNLDLLIESLKPAGIYLASVDGVSDRETAEEVLRRVAAWW